MIIRTFFLTACLTWVAGVMHCNAQSIVGKWQQISGKMYCTADAVKSSHGHLQAVMDMPKMEVVDEFKSDHTLTETITSGGTNTSNSGTWTMSGKTITLSVTGHQPMSGTISEAGNTLIFTIEMPKSEHMQVTRREYTYTRV